VLGEFPKRDASGVGRRLTVRRGRHAEECYAAAL
jgi:hypothetical protein